MFVDFNRVFKGKPQTELKIPDAMVKHLSASLPQGIGYRATEDGFCEIISEGKCVNVGGLIFTPNEEQINVLGKKYTIDDILKYSYNAQKPIPMQMKKEGYILLNGEEFPIDKIRYNPYCSGTVVLDDLFMYPPPFPEPFILTIGDTNYSRQLTFMRVPNESVHIATYESQDDQPLTVKCFVDEQKCTFSFNISYNLFYAKTIRDIVETASIFNSFVDGKGLFCGQSVITNMDTAKVKKYNFDSLAFWKKVLMVEEILEVSFIPSKDDVDFETIQMIEILYQNLINNNPIRENKKIDSLDGEWAVSENSQFENFIGESIYLEFRANSHISLFGVEKDLPCVVGIFGCMLSNYSIKGKNYKLFLENMSEDKHMYTSTLRFKTEQELLEYMDNSSRDVRINTLSNAQTVQAYLSERKSS